MARWRGFGALACACAAFADAAPLERPPVGRTLVESLFLGADPLGGGHREEEPHGGMTHLFARDLDMVFQFAPKPLNFYLELGSYEGGSAILTARHAAERGIRDLTVVAVDTFIGDLWVLWEVEPGERRRHMRADGSVTLLDRFKTNVLRSGVAGAILPLQATSIVGLKLFDALGRRGVVPRPQVIYLDSAHEEGEVLLELELAWKTVAPGGIVFGDDWVLGDGAVRRDLLRFVSAHAGELDDDFGRSAEAWGRVLGRVQRGLFLSYNSIQFFMRKLPDGVREPDPPTLTSFDCWGGGFDGGGCCSTAHGPGGNPDCWDQVYSFKLCCTPP